VLGNLSTFPIVPGSAKILDVTKHGRITDEMTGFTAITGLALDRDDHLYALELSTLAGRLAPGTGKLVVLEDGQIEEILTGLTLPVKGFRMPASQWRDEMLGGRRPKGLRGGNRGEVCAGSGVGLWRFSLCMPRSLDIERGSRPSNHRGVGFGRRVQDRNGGLVVSDLRFGGRRRDGQLRLAEGRRRR